jgi:hypothetical protein
LKYSRVVTPLRTMISPISPCGSSSKSVIGPSTWRMILTSTPGSGLPTQVPAPAMVSKRVSRRISLALIVLSGSDSVAP